MSATAGEGTGVAAADEQFTIALFGSFNPAILTKQWLTRNTGLLQPDAEFIAVQHDPELVAFAIADVHVEVTLERFLVNAADESRSSAILVVTEVLRALYHTPIEAVGASRERVVDSASALALLVDAPGWFDHFGARVRFRQLALALEATDDVEARIHIEDALDQPGALYLAAIAQAPGPADLGADELVEQRDTRLNRLCQRTDELIREVVQWSRQPTI